MTKNSASADELLKMRQELDSKQAQVSRLEGQLDGMYKQLKNGFGCDTFDAGDERFYKLKKEAEEKQKALDEGVEKLHADYKWGEG